VSPPRRMQEMRLRRGAVTLPRSPSALAPRGRRLDVVSRPAALVVPLSTLRAHSGGVALPATACDRWPSFGFLWPRPRHQLCGLDAHSRVRPLVVVVLGHEEVRVGALPPVLGLPHLACRHGAFGRARDSTSHSHGPFHESGVLAAFAIAVRVEGGEDGATEGSDSQQVGPHFAVAQEVHHVAHVNLIQPDNGRLD